MDVVREDPELPPVLADRTRFNPCSNGCRSGSQRSYQDAGRMDGVSILVLMDVVREGQRNKNTGRGPYRFNPCSNGCRSGRWI